MPSVECHSIHRVHKKVSQKFFYCVKLANRISSNLAQKCGIKIIHFTSRVHAYYLVKLR